MSAILKASGSAAGTPSARGAVGRRKCGVVRDAAGVDVGRGALSETRIVQVMGAN